MKHFLLTLSFFTLILMPFASHAQDDAPWPPDPKAIFADGVEVVETEIITRRPTPHDHDPIVDDKDRIVQVYDWDTGIWHNYPYPDEANILSKNIHVRSNESIIFNQFFGDNPPGDWPAMWILNPATGVFSRAEIVCGSQVKDLPNEGEWIFVWDTDSKNHLCFTETGAESAPLPPDVGWWTNSQSPDQKWLALLGLVVDATHPYGHPVVYSYEIATRQLNYLGETSDADVTYFENWVSNTRGTLSNGPPQESLSKDYFTFDVTEPNSLKSVVTGWMYDFYDNPPRFEYATTTGFLQWKTGTEWPYHAPCHFILYDSIGVHNYELGYDCGYARVVRYKEGYVYVRVDNNPSKLSTLVYLDTQTGSTTDLYAGEIEGVESVSPDGRYIAIVMDTNGQIDVVDNYPQFGDWSEIPNAYLAIWDTVNHQFVYHLSPFAENYSDGYWLNQDVIVIYSYDDFGQIINLASDTPTSIPFTFDLGYFSPDEQHILIGTRDYNRTYTYSVVDLATGEAKIVMYQKALSGYIMTVEWVGNDLITLILSPDLGNKRDLLHSAIYTFRIP